jgi:hypothetical protein
MGEVGVTAQPANLGTLCVVIAVEPRPRAACRHAAASQIVVVVARVLEETQFDLSNHVIVSLRKT